LTHSDSDYQSSDASLAALDATPGERTSSSRENGWKSLVVETFRHDGAGEEFELPPSPDQLLVLLTRGQTRIESKSSGKWRSAIHRPGLGGLTAGGMSSMLRWSPIGTSAVETTHIYIDSKVFETVHDEFQCARSKKTEPLDRLVLDDWETAQIAQIVVNASKTNQSNLYAESVTLFLATHLLSLQGRIPHSLDDARRVGTVATHRLDAVIAMMEANHAAPLSLGTLAREAGVSRFHFVDIFRSHVGATPHQYLLELRLTAAADILANSNESILDIAMSSGFAGASHFAKMFRKRFVMTPSEYRQHSRRGAKPFHGA